MKHSLSSMSAGILVLVFFCTTLSFLTEVRAQPTQPNEILAKPGLFQSLTEPPCSYCSTQNRKNLIRTDDPVIAWVRGEHNGGAAPIRLFLAGPRVLNDTYGLFFYDPDAGYVSVFEKDYGYEFYGWRRGVMIARSKDGTLWSALSGRAIAGPQKGKRLKRVPSVITTWGHWLMLHPESTAYDLFDGQRYVSVELPAEMRAEARESMGQVDARLQPLATVHGVWLNELAKAYPIEVAKERACFNDTLNGVGLVVFWYGPTHSSIAFRTKLEERALTFYADDISPETAPFKDRETGSRWTLAGRAVDGPLRGRELTCVDGVQCRWYAWAAENAHSDIFESKHPASH
jgi:hypothetical protein